MKCFKLLSWIGLLVTVFASFSQASWRDITYPPSENPRFTLLESDASHARVLYRFSEKDPLYRSDENVYIGIPPHADYELNIVSWHFDIYKNREFEKESISSQLSAEEKEEHERLVKRAIKAERYRYQEVDVLSIVISSNATILNGTDQSRYNRDKLSLNQLVFEITWKNASEYKPIEQTSVDAGYTKLYKNLFINAEDVPSLRRKRSIPTKEREQGFHPQSVGYVAEGERINHASDEVYPRKKALRVLVRHEGMKAIRWQDLQIEGLDPQLIALDQLRLWHKGEEQPLFIVDDGDQRMGESDAIYFYGKVSESEYTQDTPYFLTWNSLSEKPKRITDPSIEWVSEGNATYRDRERYDAEQMLVKEKRGQFGWYFEALDEKEKSVPVNLTHMATSEDIQFEMHLQNNTRKNYGFSVQIGEATQHYSISVDSATTIQMEASADEVYNATQIYIVSEKQPEEISMIERSMSDKMGHEPFVFIKFIQITYPRSLYLSLGKQTLHRDVVDEETSAIAFKPTDKKLVSMKNWHGWVIHEDQVVSRWSFDQPPEGAFPLPENSWDRLEIQRDEEIEDPWDIELDYPSSLRRKDQGYNYILIAHKDLLEGAKKLAQRRMEDGFEVLLTDVQDIYDEFNFGYPHIDAIKNFLRYGQSEWEGVSPEFVVLVGDSNWDHRDRLGYGVVDQIPTESPVKNPQRYGSDEWYAYLWGDGNDYFSDVIVGRISVRKPEEMENYVTKLATYEDEAPVGLWKTRNLFIADNLFERYSVDLTNHSLSPQIKPEYVNQIDHPHVTNPYLYHRNVDNPDPKAQEYLNKKYSPKATLALIDAFDQGQNIVQYIGHGGNQLWSHERLFYGTDKIYSNVLELAPNDRFPVILNWSCKTGYLNFHISPFNVCLSEEFLRHPDRGGIAIWAPSDEGTTDEHVMMSHFFMRNTIEDGLTRVGEATTFTKNEYMQSRRSPDLINQYILFGDPAVQIQMPKERVPMEVQPNLFLPGLEHEFRLETSFDTMQQGKAVLSMNIDDEFIYESDPLDFEEGTLEHRFEISMPEIDSSTAFIRLYAWNEEEKMDAWGGIEIPQLKPELTLEEGNLEVNEQEAVIQFEIDNPSNFTLYDVQCELTMGEVQETITVDTVEAQQKTSVEWKGTWPDETHTAYIALLEDISQGIPPSETSDQLAIPYDENPSPAVVPLTGMITSYPELLTANQIARFHIPVHNLSKSASHTVQVAISGPGSATGTKQYTMHPEQNRNFEFSITLPEPGDYEYTIHITNEDEENQYTFPITVLGQPDLAMAENDVTVSPEKPVLGQTVYLKTLVWNIGEGPAKDISVEAYDGDKSLQQRLKRFDNRNWRVTIPRLDPGESKEVEIVWDPYSYEGLGHHDIHFIVDPNNTIKELGEDNNEIRYTIRLHDLPDLAVDPWRYHWMTVDAEDGIPLWGQSAELTAQVANRGDTKAEYVRTSMIYNDEELTEFIDEIPAGSRRETSFDVPLYTAKNVMHTHVDKYDLIAEKNETTEAGNNQSNQKRLYLQLRMPQAPLENNQRVYTVQSKNEFLAGYGEYILYDEYREQLFMKGNLDEVVQRIIPSFVEDKNSYTYGSPSTKWQWNTKYNAFYSPLRSSAQLRTGIPAPNGIYDVSATLYSPAFSRGATDTILIKTQKDRDFRELVHRETGDPKAFHYLGRFNIENDTFLLDFKGVPGQESTSLGDVVFTHVEEEEEPISAGYLSPYYPAEGSGAGMTKITWEADIPEGTALNLRARWVNQNEDNSIRYLPWSRYIPGEEGELRIPGKGDFLQYYVNFICETQQSETPTFRNVTIVIPCREEKPKVKIGPSR